MSEIYSSLIQFDTSLNWDSFVLIIFPVLSLTLPLLQCHLTLLLLQCPILALCSSTTPGSAPCCSTGRVSLPDKLPVTWWSPCVWARLDTGRCSTYSAGKQPSVWQLVYHLLLVYHLCCCQGWIDMVFVFCRKLWFGLLWSPWSKHLCFRAL